MEINSDLNYTLMKFNPKQRKEFVNILESDSLFLREHNIMDYSLIIEIEHWNMTKDA